MNHPWIVAAICLALCACGEPDKPPKPVENCSNGVDDDANGLADCADAACAPLELCAVEVVECTSQQQCMEGRTYADLWWYDHAMAQCSGQKCVAQEGPAELTITVNTQAYMGTYINAFNTRFVKKVAVDGSAVTCDTLAQVAGMQTIVGNELEKSGRFNLQAFDSRSTQQALPGGTTGSIPGVDVALGGDFIVWLEAWTGKVDPNTKLPTGRRPGWACLESGPEVAPVVADDHQVRSIKVQMPSRQWP